LAPYRFDAVLVFALTALACLSNLSVPLLVQAVVDSVVAAGEWWRLPTYALAVFVVLGTQAGVSLLSTLILGRVGQGVARDLRHSLYARLQTLGLAYYDKTPTGLIISRLMDDVAAVQAFLTDQTVAILADLGTAVAVSIVLAARDARLACVALVFVAIHALEFPYFLRKIRATSTLIRAKMDRLFGHLKERIDGSLVIRAYAQEPAEGADFAAKLADVHVPRVREGYYLAALSSTNVAIGGIGSAVVFAVGAWEVVGGRMSPGAVVSTVALAALLFGPIARLADLAYTFEQAAASVQRLGEILDLTPSIAEPRAPVALTRARGRVEFDHVHFGYERDTPVLRDIRLRIEPGTKVALVGPTGSGKSTLVNLLMRFYDPLSGEIRLDDIPIQRMATSDLRRQIGIVLQDPTVFRESVAENIRYGARDASEARVKAAARAALVHEFATRLPDGYATVVGEGGHKLSQGERQRLAIARALCADPALIVLDEATSSLDTAAEALLQAALANLLRDRTAFIVAHRLSTVIDADLIVVMEKGMVVQQGTHEELFSEVGGLYHQLCVRQFGEPKLAAVMKRGDAASAIPRPHRPGEVASRSLA
jgi:ABC-type multidrug transport system fused ATPase/permease subunit